MSNAAPVAPAAIRIPTAEEQIALRQQAAQQTVTMTTGAPAALLPVDPSSDIPPILQQLGFVPTGNQKLGLFITDEGDAGTGKTNFLQTCPGPIGVIDFDKGTRGVLSHDLRGRTISRLSFSAPEFDEDGARGMSSNEWQAAKSEYLRLKYVCHELIKSDQIRTLGFETGGAAYALAQGARFGRIAMVGTDGPPAQLWTAMQQEFESIFLEAYNHGIVVVVSHRLGSKFKGMVGEKELKGYKQMQFLSDMHLRFQKRYVRVPAPTSMNPAATKEVPEMSIKILKCRTRLGADGMELPIVLLGEDPSGNGKMQSIGGTFLDVAQIAFPNIPSERWGV